MDRGTWEILGDLVDCMDRGTCEPPGGLWEVYDSMDRGTCESFEPEKFVGGVLSH